MVNENNIPSSENRDSFDLGKRSITSSKGKSRFELLADNKKKSFIFRPFFYLCLLYTSPSPRDVEESRMPSSA